MYIYPAETSGQLTDGGFHKRPRIWEVKLWLGGTGGEWQGMGPESTHIRASVPAVTPLPLACKKVPAKCVKHAVSFLRPPEEAAYGNLREHFSELWAGSKG